MTAETKISIAITHYNRYHFLVECVAEILKDPRVGEIVISDDASQDGSWEKIQRRFGGQDRFKLFRNGFNLDCYFNKAMAVRRATLDWVVLFDSDNVMSTGYLDALYALPEWNPQIAYLPDFAFPYFDYTEFSGLLVTRANVARKMARTKFVTALNTANYFFFREEYLRVWDGTVDPHTADSIFQNLNWLRGGNALQIVKGLQYFHRVHGQSHYKNNWHKAKNFTREVTETLKRMK